MKTEEDLIEEIWGLYNSELSEEEVLEKLKSYPDHLVSQVSGTILSLLSPEATESGSDPEK